MSKDSKCPITATPRYQVTTTQAEIVGNRWLINTPSKVATLTYDRHDTSTRIELPDHTLWIDVPEGAIFHVDDLALYHLHPDQYDGDIEVSDFYIKHTLQLDSYIITPSSI